jgi:hypothetical protein
MHQKNDETFRTQACNMKKTSATFKHSICNMLRILMQHIHNDCNLKGNRFAKWRRLIATCQEHCCNTDIQLLQHENANRLQHEDDRLQHAKNIIATSIYNYCNIKNKKSKTGGASGDPPAGCGRSSPRTLDGGGWGSCSAVRARGGTGSSPTPLQRSCDLELRRLVVDLPSPAVEPSTAPLRSERPEPRAGAGNT